MTLFVGTDRARLFALVAITLLFGAPASPSVILDYTGSSFSSFFGSGPTVPPDPYTTTDRVTASLTLPEPLAPNLSELLVIPVSFTVTDGVNAISESTATDFEFLFSTGAAGEILTWSIEARIVAPTDRILRTIQSSNYLGIRDEARDLLCGSDSTDFCLITGLEWYLQGAQVANDPGTWSYRSTAVPEPTMLALLGLGGMALGSSRRRR